MRTHRGSPYPLGATWDGRGVNLAVFSEVAEQVELCLFDDLGSSAETARIALPAETGGVWHGYFPDLRPGQLYGLRVHGPYRPSAGPRCNPHKVLFDPYAKAVGRDVHHDDTLFGYGLGAGDEDLTFNLADSAASAPLGAIVDPAFTWATTSAPVGRSPTPWCTRCTSRASPGATPACRSRCAEPTPAWRPPPPSSTSSGSASTRWNCSPCTTG